MGKIFISYRRSDSEYVVGRVYEELCETYGNENVFKDIESIPLGIDFRQEISKVVHSCDILLAIIGENWGTVKDENGNVRIHNSGDYVKIEIEEALKRGIPVIPIITKNASLPSERDLPVSLKELAYRNAISIRPDPDFKNDINKLKESINKIYKKPIRTKLLIPIIASLAISSIFFSYKYYTDGSSKTPETTVDNNKADNTVEYIGTENRPSLAVVKKSKIITEQGYIYNPPSNIRVKPEGDKLCRVMSKKYISIEKEPVLDYKGDFWFKTNECGKSGYIHFSQVRPKLGRNQHIAEIIDPPSNVRSSPNSRNKENVICKLKNKGSIYLYGEPVYDKKGKAWYSTNACGEKGYIHHSQFKIKY